MSFLDVAGASSPEFSRAPRLSAEAVKQAATDKAEELFRLAWGEPARPSARQWRAKESSALAMWISGPRRGQWHDFKSGSGGDILDYIAAQFLGLSSARDDFAAVLEEAARLCGYTEASAPSADVLQAIKLERLRASQKAEEAEAAQKAALVARLQEKAQEPAQSPAQAYLQSRGIDALPESGLAYLPPVSEPVRNRQWPALVVWAQDNDGRVMGGQRILTGSDGSKAPVDARKISFGNVAGYPARFPQSRKIPESREIAPFLNDGKAGQGLPLYIAEGPETALAIWQATGAEVWAVFGADFFAKAPAPIGRPIILCPDCDAPGSPAAEAFNRGCEELAARGCEVWIARAPEPEGSKRDFADTLQESGLEAVANALQKAAKFTPRDCQGRFTGSGAIEAQPVALPEFLEVAEVQARIKSRVRDFLELQALPYVKAKARLAELCENRDWAELGEIAELALIQTEPAPVLAIAASPGTGKSRGAREALADFISQGGLEELGGDIVFYLPTIKQAEEAARHAWDTRQSGWHITRGRSAINPFTREPMCERWQEAEAVARAGMPVKPTLCERETEHGLELCPHHAKCAYLRQWEGIEGKPVLRFETSAYLPLGGDGSGRTIALRVIDETIWRAFTRKADLPFDRWQAKRRVITDKDATPEEQAKAKQTAEDAT